MKKYLTGGDVRQVRKIADVEIKGHVKKLHVKKTGQPRGTKPTRGNSRGK
jgi:hypothetical protein